MSDRAKNLIEEVVHLREMFAIGFGGGAPASLKALRPKLKQLSEVMEEKLKPLMKGIDPKEWDAYAKYDEECSKQRLGDQDAETLLTYLFVQKVFLGEEGD